MTWAAWAAGVASLAGLLVGAITLVALRRGRLALAAMLELWTAAGLLRLVGAPSWRAIVATAALVGVRRLVARAALRRCPCTARSSRL